MIEQPVSPPAPKRRPARRRPRRLRPEQEAALFLSRWLKAPNRIGAVAPSSRGLSRAMARQVDPLADGVVVELGGGTGSITRALLERGVSPAHLVVVERDRTLAALLRQRFPGVKVVRGDAAELVELLRPLGLASVDTVVSSLPLLSMPKRLRERIVAESFALLGEGGIFVQFTYGVASPLAAPELGLAGEVAQRIFLNFPPAAVWRFRRLVSPVAKVA
ncbi:MAG TPA: methyltransferase domain-containing protein [Stellaceae bacterium]|nr:methyltransferase domain-containing protein [Stellaceae bacterium]